MGRTRAIFFCNRELHRVSVDTGKEFENRFHPRFLANFNEQKSISTSKLECSQEVNDNPRLEAYLSCLNYSKHQTFNKRTIL